MAIDSALDSALHTAITACGERHASDLVHARALWRSPLRVVVVGRTGAGKTSFLAARTGRLAPTGLGGVTRAASEHHDGAVTWVDTPGIDDPHVAMLVLAPVLDDADAVVWVIDGLQPMTSSEREVLAALLPVGIAVWGVIAKADLVDEGEIDSVVGRVAAIGCAPGTFAGLVAADLRRDAAAVANVAEVVVPGPARRQALRNAVSTTAAALDADPAPPHPQVLVARWRQRIRALVAAIDARIVVGALSHEAEALAALYDASGPVLEAFATMGPRLPPPKPLERTALGQLLSGLSGVERARRAVRAEAGRWLAEGEWVLHDEWPGAAAQRRAAEQRAQAEAALADLTVGLTAP